MTQVSIIIPCRNAATWIVAAIKSALGQTHTPAEVIVVDDASTDDSSSRIASFGDRVRLIQGPWRNGNAARNAGLTAANGEWIQFLDADDYLEPEKIARQLAEAGDIDTADVLYSPTWIETWRDSRTVHREVSPLDTNTDLFTQWFTWQLPQTGGALWRREALLRYGGWKEGQPCCQEHELYLRALEIGFRFRHCPTAGAIYRIWSEKTVCRIDPVLVIREKTRLIDAAIDWLRHHDRLLPAHLAAAGQACFEMARTWAKVDLGLAAAYSAQRRAAGLFLARGPAAPGSYRIMMRILGFSLAERLAASLR